MDSSLLRRNVQTLYSLVVSSLQSGKRADSCEDPDKSKNDNCQYIILYGELFGGFYPEDPGTWRGPVQGNRITSEGICTVPQETRAVQEGVYYSQNLDFVAYDLLIVSVKDGKRERAFLCHSTLQRLCKKAAIKVLPPLLAAPYAQCMQYNVRFDSRIAVDLCDHPPMASETNYAEGVVIKPLQRWNVTESGPRPIIKSKHPNFLEVKSVFSSATDTMTDARDMLLSMVNVNRVNALRSKLGKFEKCDLESNVDLVIDDVLADYYETFSAESHPPFAIYKVLLEQMRTRARSLIMIS